MKFYYLCILFSKLSVQNNFFFPFLTAFEFCPLTFLKFSEAHHIKDSIWQGLDSIFDNILTVFLSLTVATSDSPWISCCLALHIRQRAAILWRNIRACGTQKTWIPGASLKGMSNRDRDAQTSLTAIVKMNLTTYQLKGDCKKDGMQTKKMRTLGVEGGRNGQENLDEEFPSWESYLCILTILSVCLSIHFRVHLKVPFPVLKNFLACCHPQLSHPSPFSSCYW